MLALLLLEAETTLSLELLHPAKQITAIKKHKFKNDNFVFIFFPIINYFKKIFKVELDNNYKK
jgi:hypothetical protein